MLDTYITCTVMILDDFATWSKRRSSTAIKDLASAKCTTSWTKPRGMEPTGWPWLCFFYKWNIVYGCHRKITLRIKFWFYDHTMIPKWFHAKYALHSVLYAGVHDCFFLTEMHFPWTVKQQDVRDNASAMRHRMFSYGTLTAEIVPMIYQQWILPLFL